MREVIAQGGVLSLIGAETISQEVGPRLDVGIQEAPQFRAGGGRQDSDPGGACVEAVLALYGMAMLSALGLRSRNLFNGGDDEALVRIIRAASRTGRITTPADEGLVGLD
jgi:hypothetical protein